MCVQGCLRVPDHGGVRFCIQCKDFISIDCFSSGTRRYMCKQHMWEAIGQKYKVKMMKDPRKRALNKVWNRAYEDCRKFKHARIDIKQAEIDKILTVGVEEEVEENVALYQKISNEIAVVPVDPTKVLCTSNSVIVSIRTRRLLMKQWKKFGKKEYCKLLRKEQRFCSMHPIENLSDSPGNSDDTSDGKTLPNDNIQITEP
jgi:hypothetical protein